MGVLHEEPACRAVEHPGAERTRREDRVGEDHDVLDRPRQLGPGDVLVGGVGGRLVCAGPALGVGPQQEALELDPRVVGLALTASTDAGSGPLQAVADVVRQTLSATDVVVR
jgi:hypothetical protein